VSTFSPIFIELLYSTNLQRFDYLNDYIGKKIISLKENSNGISGTSWLCDTFNSLGLDDLKNDDQLDVLFKAFIEEVIFVSKKYGVDTEKVNCIDSWINLALPGAYQEFHTHPKSHFSLVYYVQVPEQSGRIVFSSPRSQGMFPLPTSKHVQANCNTYVYSPKENDLLIFRSDLSHMVEKNNSQYNRISISANFVFED
jgi:uncharacterized protein (TIGR02466 family)